MTSVWLFILLVSIAAIIYWALTGIARARMWDADQHLLADPEQVPYRCRIQGHKYAAHGTVWACLVCGNRVPRNAIRWCDEDPYDQDGVA